MAKLDDLIQQKQQRDEDWKAKKTAEREELGQLSDDAVMRVTSEPGAYLHYLDTQAINPRYSASNVMLAMAQNPEITYINSLEVWNRLGRSVNRDENGMKIRVSDTYVKDGREYKGDVTRSSCDTVIYTAVFSSVGAAASAKSGGDFNWLWLLLPVGAAALGGCGYAGYKGYKHYINKKRGCAA